MKWLHTEDNPEKTTPTLPLGLQKGQATTDKHGGWRREGWRLGFKLCTPQCLVVTPSKTPPLRGPSFSYLKKFKIIMFPLPTSGVLVRLFWDSGGKMFN